jgi:hypothetical protein
LDRNRWAICLDDEVVFIYLFLERERERGEEERKAR